MNGLAFAFMVLGVLSTLVGRAWGIRMSSAGDQGMALFTVVVIRR